MTAAAEHPEITPRDVPRPPREPLSSLARGRILQAAGALFANHGVANVTLEMVAESLNRPVDSVRESFPTIESLMIACLSYVNLGVHEGAFGEEPVRGWRAIDEFMATAEGGHLDSGLFALYSDAVVLASNPAHPANDWLVAHMQMVREHIVTGVLTGIEDGQLAEGTDPEAVYQLVTTFIHGLIPACRIVGPAFDAGAAFKNFRNMLVARFATAEYLEGPEGQRA